MVNIPDIYWAAGFLEGEGYFFWSSSTRIRSNQRQLQPLTKLQSLLGGKIYWQKHNQYTDGGIWVWEVCGERARGIMYTLYLLLSPKRQEQIRKALQRWKDGRAWTWASVSA